MTWCCLVLNISQRIQHHSWTLKGVFVFCIVYSIRITKLLPKLTMSHTSQNDKLYATYQIRVFIYVWTEGFSVCAHYSRCQYTFSYVNPCVISAYFHENSTYLWVSWKNIFKTNPSGMCTEHPSSSGRFVATMRRLALKFMNDWVCIDAHLPLLHRRSLYISDSTVAISL